MLFVRTSMVSAEGKKGQGAGLGKREEGVEFSSVHAAKVLFSSSAAISTGGCIVGRRAGVDPVRRLMVGGIGESARRRESFRFGTGLYLC